MDLPAITYTGRPTREVFRPVDPPQTVIVDLGVLFPRQPHYDGRYNPDGLQMRARVEGRLTCWGMCTDGMWWGLCAYAIEFGGKRRTVRHWIPAWMLLKV